jgi:hypothetical protein
VLLTFPRVRPPHAVALLALLTAAPVLAQDAAPPELRKQATASRIPSGAIRIDGRLDETQWEQATPIRDFVQKEPVAGAAPTEAMEVRILYDDDALYVGARMSKAPGSAIQAPMGRRDRVEQSEHILVALDTFLDRRTAYVFGVTAAGVRVDRYHGRDDEAAFDETFDPVWQARTAIGAGEWTAELWIPFSQLRFNSASDVVWGLNVHRYTPTLEEDDYWVAVPRTVRAWSSQFGTLAGIAGLESSRRIEISPYVASASTIVGDADPANPFTGGANLSARSGADLKVGLGSSLTLEATINPDFGQVEADPAEVNLTAVETFFAEKRPFFIEGAGMLNLQAEPNFFYSRRIGAPPLGRASGDFVDMPAASTILGAAKITGRLSSGTSIGVLGAVTGEGTARTFTAASGAMGETRVAPRTLFAVSRVQQEFGAAQSIASAMTTVVHRDLPEGDPLAALLPRLAVVSAAESILRFRDGEYELTSYGGVSFLRGAADAIARVQRGSTHFAQRPDRDHAPYDPTRTSYDGYWVHSTLARTSGRHWLGSVTTDLQSPSLDTNDAGRLNSGDAIAASGDLRYRETVPGRVFRSYWIGARQNNEWTYGGERATKSMAVYSSQTWLNFWVSQVTYTRNFARFDPRLTRGGPIMTLPRGWNLNAQLRNSAASQTTWRLELATSGNDDGGFNNRLIGRFGFRLGSRWQISIDPTAQRQVETQQYITTLEGGRPDTVGRRYVFGLVDRSTYSTQFRVGLTVRPDLNVDLYAEPFAASGRYTSIGELLAPATRLRRTYGADGTAATRLPDGSLVVTDELGTFRVPNSDFRVKSFRSNLVLRWEYRPGSILYVVWQQDRESSEPFGRRIDPADPFRSLSAPGTNSFVIKTSFWLPVG